MYDILVAKVDNIDTSDFMLKTNYKADKTKLEKKIPDVTEFFNKVKFTELENKIPDVRNLATKTALTAVENKIPDVSNLVKKTNYNTKITDKFMINTLLLQSLILWLQMFLMQE